MSGFRHHGDAILNRERFCRKSPDGNGGNVHETVSSLRQRNENELKSTLGKRRFQDDQMREVDDEKPRRFDQSSNKGGDFLDVVFRCIHG